MRYPNIHAPGKQQPSEPCQVLMEKRISTACKCFIRYMISYFVQEFSSYYIVRLRAAEMSLLRFKKVKDW